MEITTFVHSNRDKAFLVGDYSTYRSQLSRQLLSLRRKLGRTTPKNQKFASKAPITAQDVGKSHDFVRLQLLTAERAWSHAMAMKSAHAEGQGDATVTGSSRKHVLSRLQKASRYADELVSIVQQRDESKASDQDMLETIAYARTLTGAYEFEKQLPHRRGDPKEQKAAWDTCLVAFSEAHIICTALLKSSKKDVFKEVLAGTIDPSIRYAAYQSQLPRSVAIPTVAKQHFRRSDKMLLSLVQTIDPEALADEKAAAKKTNKEEDTTDVPTLITWRGRVAPISDAAVGQALAATSSEAAKLRAIFTNALADAKPHTLKQVAAAYDPVLTAAQDTVDAVRRALTDLSKESVPESDPRMQDLRVTDLAVNYELISWRVGRNRILISSPPSSTTSSLPSPKQEKNALDDGLNFALLPAASPKRRYTKPKSKSATTTTTNGDAEFTKPKAPEIESTPHALSRLTTRCALYDSTLQSLTQLSTLRGAARSPGFTPLLDAYTAYFSALRALNIAHSHKLLGQQKEALALLMLARDRIEAVDESSIEKEEKRRSEEGTPRLEVSSAQWASLKTRVVLLAGRQHGLVALQELIPPLSSHSKKLPSDTDNEAEVEDEKHHKDEQPKPDPVVDHLDRYPSDGVADLTNLVTYPPRFLPVPVKPIFLDLAWNYIQYPGQEGKAEGKVNGSEETGSEKREEQGTKKKGWFGFGGR